MSEKKYTLKFFVTVNDVASGTLTCNVGSPEKRDISDIDMYEDPVTKGTTLNGTLSVNGNITAVIKEKVNGKAKVLKVTCTGSGNFGFNDKSFNRVEGL